MGFDLPKEMSEIRFALTLYGSDCLVRTMNRYEPPALLLMSQLSTYRPGSIAETRPGSIRLG